MNTQPKVSVNARKPYDYLIVGAGLYGAVFAHEMTERGKRCLVIDRRDHIGGNCYTEEVEGIRVHKYGAHIFRTSDPEVWQYIQQFAQFNHFVNSPIANYKGEIYNMPFNMNTFSKMWGIRTPEEARAKIDAQRRCIDGAPKNLEEHVISMVGTDIYEKLVKGYTEKQWGRSCRELPASIIRRLPVRFIYDNNYFNDPYQGIPIGGYTKIFEKLLAGCDIRLGVDYNDAPETYEKLARRILYTGTIDGYYHYCFGPLAYRSLRFEHETLPVENYQGVAVVNYTDRETPYTRIIEHKHFEFGKQASTVITREYPLEWSEANEPYYPINDEKNQARYEKYADLARNEKNVIFGGRLGEYKYTDMQDTILAARAAAKQEKE